MSKHRIEIAGALMLTVLAVGACRDREPQERFARDLGADTGDLVLLPSARDYAWIDDNSILQGRAELVQPGEIHVDAAPSGPQGAPAQPSAPGDGSLGEALSSLGQAFLGNMLGAKQDPSGSAPTPAAELTQADRDEIGQLVEQLNTAITDRDYTGAVPLFIEAERSFWQALLETLEELDGSISALGDAMEEKQPGSKAQVVKLMGETMKPPQLQQVTPAGPDSALVEFADGSRKTAVREADGWRLKEGLSPDLDPTSVVDNITPLIDEVDELTDAVYDGSVSPDDARQRVNSVIERLKGLLR